MSEENSALALSESDGARNAGALSLLGGWTLPAEFKKKLEQRTPKAFIVKKPGPKCTCKGRDVANCPGMHFDTVEIGYVRRRLDELFTPFGWDSEVREATPWEVVGKTGQLAVHVRLLIKDPLSGRLLTSKENYGSSDVKFYASGDKSGQPLDIGNDLKAAAADGLKKCAAMLGICADIYEPKVQAKKDRENPDENGTAIEPTSEPVAAEAVPAGEGRISENLWSQLYKITRSRGIADAHLQNHCVKHYKVKSRQLTMSQFNEVIKWAEEHAQAAGVEAKDKPAAQQRAEVP